MTKTRIGTLAALLVAALAITGCASDTTDDDDDARDERTDTEQAPPAVEETPAVRPNALASIPLGSGD